MCKIQEDSYLTINYKKIKKKSFNPRVISNFNMILIVSIFLSETVASEDYSLHRCDAPTQQNIFENLPQCMPRPRLVDMRKHFTHHHDIIQVVPDHVMVDRCGGSCYMESYNCIPEATSMTKVQVMLVQSKFPHGKHDTMCSEVEVEVHNSCKCGCKTKREHCNRLQYYHEQSCRCICDNTEERSACIAADKVWDPDTCQCHCPIHTIQPCSTCYMFDLSTCKCVLICGEAGWGLIAASLVLFFLSVTIVISLYIMHKQKTGLFKESTISNSNSRRSTNDSQVQRTFLMSQESKYEYERASKDNDVTLLQFDLNKKSVGSQQCV